MNSILKDKIDSSKKSNYMKKKRLEKAKMKGKIKNIDAITTVSQ